MLATFIFTLYFAVSTNGVPATVKTCTLSTMGGEYLGTISMTTSGRTCQRWDSQTPHQHVYNQTGMFPDRSVSDANNYCRSPDDHFYGPWCYTTDPNVRWENCSIPKCHAFPECKLSTPGTEYRGSLAQTINGNSCLNWDLVPTDPDDYSELPENFCRNPDGKPGGPWCYLDDLSWDHCDVPYCDLRPQCKETSTGQEFNRTMAITVTGQQCQNWDRQHPHSHPFTDPALFPDETLEDATNYCRNPDGKPGGPWCFTINPDITWEYCNIPLCSDCGPTCEKPTITKHVIHIGVDGLHPGCMGNTTSGSPNMLIRLARNGTYTLKNARTLLKTVSGPSWTSHLCAMPETSTGIVNNYWSPPWEGTLHPISPVTGNQVPIPCIFSQLKGLDRNVRTAAFHDWDWLRYHMNAGNAGVVDHEYYCDEYRNGYVICDDMVTQRAVEYLRDILVSAPKSYTFVYYANIDVVGHETVWCSEEYLQAVDVVDQQVGLILDVLDELGLSEDVLVMLSSDHGGGDDGHGHQRDSDVIIPMIIRGPRVKKNFEFPIVVSNMDIAPTSVWALGYEPNNWWEGVVMSDAFDV